MYIYSLYIKQKSDQLNHKCVRVKRKLQNFNCEMKNTEIKKKAIFLKWNINITLYFLMLIYEFN